MIRRFRFLIFFIIIIFLVLIVFRQEIYSGFIVKNKNIFPEFITKLIDQRINRKSVVHLVYKPEETIKILEGWTTSGINQYFKELGKWPNEELFNIIGLPQTDYRKEKNLVPPKDFSDQFSFLSDKPSYYGLEGYLFPDTYRVYTDATLEDVVIKMLENFDKKLTPQMRAAIRKQGKTIYEIITMASIIEKEAPIIYQINNINNDAKIISGIFWGRLKIGQALQSDATLSYIFNDNKPGHSGEELENNSLYNTYKFRGLPPGPICNPGILAIEAAIYPIETEYNYFLTPPNSKDVIYSATYQEHLANKYKYLK